jgi:hypothetical protein
MTLVLATCVVGALGVASTTCGDQVRVYTHLERTPIETRARGSLHLEADDQWSALRIRVRKLAPESEYLLLADGVEQTRFTTDSKGRASLLLQYFPSAGIETLSFDPRGKRISVSDGSEDRLSAVVDGPGESPWSHVLESAGIPASDPEEPGRAGAAYQSAPLGCRIFKLGLHGVAPGTYQVQVDGAPVGEIEANPGGHASLRLQHPGLWGRHCFLSPGRRRGAASQHELARAPLDFEPRGARVEVIRDGEVVFAGPMRAQVALPEEPDTCPVVDIEVSLDSVYGIGAGEASMQSKDDPCSHEFRVEVTGLSTADYRLWVGDADVGAVRVRPSPGGARGEIRFDTEPDEPDELLLDFDPRGQPVEVRRPFANPPLAYLEALFPEE